MIKNLPFSATHWTFSFPTVMIHTTTNVTKCCQIPIYLFQIKLNTLLLPLTEHFTLKVSRNVKSNVKWCHRHVFPIMVICCFSTGIYFFICMEVIYILIPRGQGLAIAGGSHNYIILLPKNLFLHWHQLAVQFWHVSWYFASSYRMHFTGHKSVNTVDSKQLTATLPCVHC